MCRKASDYSLSLMFQPEPRDGYSPSERLRLFENIASHGTLPADGTHPKRNGFDIVDEVGKRPGYAWTKEIFESPFWYLLLNPGMNAQQLSEFIVQCIIQAYPKYSLQEDCEDSISREEIDDLGIDHIENFFIDRSPLSKVYGHPTSHNETNNILDYLAMLGALFKDAYLSGALHMALLLKEAFINELNCCGSDLTWVPSVNQTELVSLAKSIVLRSHIFSENNYPNILEIYRTIAADRLQNSDIAFLKIHRERIQNDYQNHRPYKMQLIHEAFLSKVNQK